MGNSSIDQYVVRNAQVRRTIVRQDPAQPQIQVFQADRSWPSGVTGIPPSATPSGFVSIGLWDRAFTLRDFDVATGQTRYIANGHDPLLRDYFNGAGEQENMIGRDQRRFYIRVIDRRATGNEISVNWLTTWGSGNIFHRPIHPEITLTRTGNHQFDSQALMIVTEQEDLIPVHSGLASGTIASVDGPQYRMRRGDMFSFVTVEYVSRRTHATETFPIFQRNPETRRAVGIQLMVLSIAGRDVVPVNLTDPLWTEIIPRTRQVLGRIGLWVYTTPFSLGGERSQYQNYPTTVDPSLRLSNGEHITRVRSSHPLPLARGSYLLTEFLQGLAQDLVDPIRRIRVVLLPANSLGVRTITGPGTVSGTGNAGVTLSGALYPANNNLQHICFIDGSALNASIHSPYVVAHEIVHALADSQTNNGQANHFVGSRITMRNNLPVGMFGEYSHKHQLMMDGSSLPGADYYYPKRIIDQSDAMGYNFYQRILDPAGLTHPL